MNKGAVLIARNNSHIDYVKQANFAAKRIKQYLNIPVTLITDKPVEFESNFDSVVILESEYPYTRRTYNNGIHSKVTIDFNNTSRRLAYDLSPYDQTLLLDTDFIVSDSLLANCFNMPHDFMIYKDAVELSGWRDLREFEYISDTGPDFYWATVVFFRKTPENKKFFDLLKYLQENWDHYKTVFGLNTAIFRNDHLFSIAIHMMNGFKQDNFAKQLPGKLFYTTDKDVLISLKDDEFKLLIESKESADGYFLTKIKGTSLHVMNKFSLNEIIDNDA